MKTFLTLFVLLFSSSVFGEEEQIAMENNSQRLLLVTCFPFDAIRSGTPYRYVVNASQNLENDSLVN